MQNGEIKSLLHSKEGALLCYSPYSFFRDIEHTRLVNDTVVEPLVEAIKRGSTNTVNITVKNREHVFFVKKLQWDTEYFKFPIYKIEYIFYDHTDINIFRCHQFQQPATIFADFPGVLDLRSSCRHCNGLIQTFTSRVHLIVATGEGFPRCCKTWHGINMVYTA